MIKTPYESLAIRKTDIKKTVKALQILDIEGDLITVPTIKKNVNLNPLYTPKPGSDVPLFTHPIDIGDSEPRVVVNTALQTKLDREGNIVITNVGDYKMTVLYGLLTDVWLRDHNDLRSLGQFPQKVFVEWITGTLTTRFKLDVPSQIRLKIVVTYYWYSMFTNDIAGLDKQRIMESLIRNSYMSNEQIDPIYDSLGYIDGLDSLVDNIKTIVGDVRLEPLSTGLFYSLLNRGWFGLNSIEITSVALEYPPTFLAILLTVVEDRSYRKSTLGRLAERLDKRNIAKEFTSGIMGLVTK